MSYLEEDTLAWGNLHYASPVHVQRIEFADRIAPVVASAVRETVEPSACNHREACTIITL